MIKGRKEGIEIRKAGGGGVREHEARNSYTRVQWVYQRATGTRPQSEGQVAHHGHPISTTHGWGETDKAGIGEAGGLEKD